MVSLYYSRRVFGMRPCLPLACRPPGTALLNLTPPVLPEAEACDARFTHNRPLADSTHFSFG